MGRHFNMVEKPILKLSAHFIYIIFYSICIGNDFVGYIYDIFYKSNKYKFTCSYMYSYIDILLYRDYFLQISYKVDEKEYRFTPAERYLVICIP